MYYPGRFEYVEFGQEIPKNHLVRFVVALITNIVKIFKIEDEVFRCHKAGREAYSLQKMASLVYYSYCVGFTNPEVISDMAKYHTFFRFAGNGIMPSPDAIEMFINKWGSFIEFTMKYSVHFAKIAKITAFENVCIDSFYKKAANSKFNVLHKDDTETLIKYYSNTLIDNSELDDLRYPAKRFINREDLSNKKKLELLNIILKRFEETGSNTIPVHDVEAIHITNKKGNADLGYNIQTAVDYMSKMFVMISVSQKATDHNQFPDSILKAIENMGQMPDTSCADAGYRTRRTLEFIEETGLDALIDSNRGAKLRNGHGSDDKYHKDNMKYLFDEDCFECCCKEHLIYQGSNIKWDEKKSDYKIDRIYFNKEACAKCSEAYECCGGKYRKVTYHGGVLAIKMDKKFENYLDILEYIKRFSTVEAPNGTLQNFYHVNEMLTTGVDRLQNRLNVCGGSYNLKRLFNELMKMIDPKKDNIVDIVNDLCLKTYVDLFVTEKVNLPFIDEPLLLEYKCRSVVEREWIEELNKYKLLYPVQVNALQIEI